MEIVQEAPAKVNLTLRVTGRRPDGYHELQSIVAFADVGDHLAFAPAAPLELRIRGPFAPGLADDGQNLVLRAAEALRRRHRLTRGARITLTKRLPVAAGIGGGSSDAAAALLGLCRLWQLTPSFEALNELALSLGADVPVCLAGQPCLMSGIGEDIMPISIPDGLCLVLMNPMAPLSTAQVFAAREGPYSGVRPSRQAWENLPSFLSDMVADRNDLQEPACRLAPQVFQCLGALEEQEGCHLARMSGSGATCFGLFTDLALANAASSLLSQRHPDWWVTAGPLRASIGSNGQYAATECARSSCFEQARREP